MTETLGRTEVTINIIDSTLGGILSRLSREVERIGKLPPELSILEGQDIGKLAFFSGGMVISNNFDALRRRYDTYIKQDLLGQIGEGFQLKPKVRLLNEPIRYFAKVLSQTQDNQGSSMAISQLSLPIEITLNGVSARFPLVRTLFRRHFYSQVDLPLETYPDDKKEIDPLRYHSPSKEDIHGFLSTATRLGGKTFETYVP